MQARWVAMHASRMKGVQVEVKQLDDMEKAGILGCIVKIVEHNSSQNHEKHPKLFKDFCEPL